jgi:hypothetical protein
MGTAIDLAGLVWVIGWAGLSLAELGIAGMGSAGLWARLGCCGLDYWLGSPGTWARLAWVGLGFGPGGTGPICVMGRAG